jgi:hypothetical protein
MKVILAFLEINQLIEFRRNLFDQKKNEILFIFIFRQVCSSRIAKRWKGSVSGPMAIDYINQMLEARKVKSYPYSAEIDPYLV